MSDVFKAYERAWKKYQQATSAVEAKLRADADAHPAALAKMKDGQPSGAAQGTGHTLNGRYYTDAELLWALDTQQQFYEQKRLIDYHHGRALRIAEEELNSAIAGWSDLTQRSEIQRKIFNWAVYMNDFKHDELSHLLDYRLVIAFWKAMKWDESQPQVSAVQHQGHNG